MDLEFGTPIHFNYSVTVLRVNMKDYDATRVKLVCLVTLNYFQIFVSLLESSVLILITQIQLTDLDSHRTQRTLGHAMHQPHPLLSKWFYDTSPDTATRAVRGGSLIGWTNSLNAEARWTRWFT
jgi:hypothetical protein